MMKNLVLSISLLLFAVTLSAQPSHKHQFLSGDAKDFFWKNSDPKYHATEVPEKWKEESVVYLNFENHYETKSLRGSEKSIVYLAHRRLKILEESALSNFSEIYLSTKAHGFYEIKYTVQTRRKDFFGLKVIKPNGEEIIMDNETIIEEKNGQKKMAIANLEVGDIIDYYIYTYDVTRMEQLYAIYDKFPIESEYPIVELVYELETDKNWHVKMLETDTNVEIEETKVGKKLKNYKFRFVKKDIEPVSSNRWHYAYQNSPYLKLFVQYKPDELKNRERSRRNWRTAGLSPNNIIDAYRGYYVKDNKASNEYRSFEKYLKKAGKTELSMEDKLEEYYYYIRHIFINKYYITDRYSGQQTRFVSAREFTGHIIYGLDQLGVTYDIIVVATRPSGKISEVVDVIETDYLIRANLPDKPLYFYKPSPFTPFNYYPSVIEDTDGYLVSANDQRSKGLAVEVIHLPKSNFADNIIEYRTTAHLNADDPTLLETSTKATFNGHHLFDYQYPLIDWITMIWEENELYKSVKWGHPDNLKGNQKVGYEEFIAADLKSREENFKSLAANHFDTEIKELTDFEAYNTGNKIGERDVQVRFDATIEKFVNKIGPNYVVKAGQLVGGQIDLSEESERNNDIYMDYARGFDYEVNFKVPSGYEVKGLENFKNEVENSTGSLHSSAVLNGDVVTIKFKKIYKSNYEPAKNWALMRAFLKPGAEFASKELLLKKK